MSDSKNSGGGIGFCGLLTIVFVVLKLTHVIAWSWWWVTSPIWIPACILIVIAFVAFMIALRLKHGFTKRMNTRALARAQKKGN